MRNARRAGRVQLVMSVTIRIANIRVDAAICEIKNENRPCLSSTLVLLCPSLMLCL